MIDSSNVLSSSTPLCTVTQQLLDQLKEMALNSSLKRARYCMHLSHEDGVQEMVIALHHQTYIRPHRHPAKSESFHMIEGEVLVVLFTNDGKVDRFLNLNTDVQKTFLYRLSKTKWHTVIPLTEYAIVHEVVTGPFESPQYPTWEPPINEKAINTFLQELKQQYVGVQ